jgi:hypothetical protein
MKRPLFLLLCLALAVLAYGGSSALIQKLLILRLEDAVELKITGRNETPYSLFSARFRALQLRRGDQFSLSAGRARIHFSPLEMLFGQIPLVIRAEDVTIASGSALFDEILPEAEWGTLESRMTVFCGKGVWVESFRLQGDGLTLSAQGRLLKRGKGASDLKAELALSGERLSRRALGLLTGSIFSSGKEPAAVSRPLTFSFRLRGDITHPDLALESDWLSVRIGEKGSGS